MENKPNSVLPPTISPPYKEKHKQDEKVSSLSLFFSQKSKLSLKPFSPKMFFINICSQKKNNSIFLQGHAIWNYPAIANISCIDSSHTR